tara:strand:+ start:199 stop:519 length:321 start_codon:yes stop_codon:yes gene_type:complete
MKDIYHNSKKKDRQITTLIQELRPLIKNIGDATIIAPIMKEYLDVQVKNDDHLIKLASIVQRLISASSKVSDSGDDFGMTDLERERLLQVATDELTHIQKENEELK